MRAATGRRAERLSAARRAGRRGRLRPRALLRTPAVARSRRRRRTGCALRRAALAARVRPPDAPRRAAARRAAAGVPVVAAGSDPRVARWTAGPGLAATLQRTGSEPVRGAIPGGRRADPGLH